MRKFVKISYLVFFLSSITTTEIHAQCAMCKSTVESNQKEAQSAAEKKARGLNNGILYLMIVPYLAIATIGYFWYIQSKRSRTTSPNLK